MSINGPNLVKTGGNAKLYRIANQKQKPLHSYWLIIFGESVIFELEESTFRPMHIEQVI
jgi:hypothetical protein